MSLESALALIESVADYHVLFVGDTIIDQYHYVTPLGKSPKENLVPVQYHSSESFSGGVEAAANHLRTFCKTVSIHTNVNGVRKVRMVDRDYFRKLFEVHYNGNKTPLAPCGATVDCVVITDFGHGCMGKDMVAWSASLPYVAINAQTNSANVGYNLITKYPRADYIVIDEPEARLAAQDRESPIEDVILKLATGRCNKFIVTHGSRGSVGWDGERFYRHGAFTDRPIDTMGAGDAFFAVTAPMSKHGTIEDLLLIGDVAGALKTQIVGHRQAVTKDAVVAYLRETL